MFWNFCKLSKKCFFFTDYLKTYNKKVIKFCFRFISWIIKPRHRVYLTQPSPSVDNLDLGFDTSCYHVQTHPKIAYFCQSRVIGRIQNTKIVNNCHKSYKAWLTNQKLQHEQSLCYNLPETKKNVRILVFHYFKGRNNLIIYSLVIACFNFFYYYF